VFHGRRHPRELGAPDVSAFLIWLAVEQHVAASTQNQALSGVLFLYRHVLRLDIGVVELLPRARMPTKVPVVLSPSEVRQVLDQLIGVPRIVATLLYGAGFRLQECLELRVKDLDFERLAPDGVGADTPSSAAGLASAALASELRNGRNHRDAQQALEPTASIAGR
jgi:site-specific recombinase XerD